MIDDTAALMRAMRLGIEVDPSKLREPLERQGGYLWRIDGGAVWWVQAPTIDDALEAVLTEMRREGVDTPEDLAEMLPSPESRNSGRRLSTREALEHEVRINGEYVPMLDVFTGAPTAVLACSEWDGD